MKIGIQRYKRESEEIYGVLKEDPTHAGIPTPGSSTDMLSVRTATSVPDRTLATGWGGHPRLIALYYYYNNIRLFLL